MSKFLVWTKTSEVVENADESGFGEGQVHLKRSSLSPIAAGLARICVSFASLSIGNHGPEAQ